jgi:hypothetical protein
MIKSRRIRWTGNAARIEKRNAYKNFDGKARRKETTRKTYT